MYTIRFFRSCILQFPWSKVFQARYIFANAYGKSFEVLQWKKLETLFSPFSIIKVCCSHLYFLFYLLLKFFFFLLVFGPHLAAYSWLCVQGWPPGGAWRCAIVVSTWGFTASAPLYKFILTKLASRNFMFYSLTWLKIFLGCRLYLLSW